MPVKDLTKTREYKRMMRRQVQQHRALLEDLGYAADDYDVQEYVLYHVLGGADGLRNNVKAIALRALARAVVK